MQRCARDFERWGEVRDFADLGAFEAEFSGRSQPFSIDLDGLPLDGLFRPGEGDTLFVCFSSTVTRAPDRVLPMFHWLAHTRPCAGSALFLADPALVLSEVLTLAWYLGTPAQPLLPVLRRVVATAARAAGAQRIAFIGSSGGGFPALRMAEHFPGSAVFANAPTTRLLGWPERFAVRRFCDLIMDGQPIRHFPGLMDLPTTPPGRDGTRIIITQNRDDTPFLTGQVQPFLRGAGLDWSGGDLVSEHVLLRIGEPSRWGKGHVMPPRDVARVILQAMDRVEGPGFAGLDLAALHRAVVAADPAPLAS